MDCGEDFDSYNFVFFPYPDVVGDYFMGELGAGTGYVGFFPADGGDE